MTPDKTPADRLEEAVEGAVEALRFMECSDHHSSWDALKEIESDLKKAHADYRASQKNDQTISKDQTLKWMRVSPDGRVSKAYMTRKGLIRAVFKGIKKEDHERLLAHQEAKGYEFIQVRVSVTVETIKLKDG